MADPRLGALAHNRARAYDRNKIWWLASYPKSGNTWLRAFICAYLQSGRVNINAMGIAGNGDTCPYYYQAIFPRPLEQMTFEETVLIRSAALLHMTCFHNDLARPLFLKTHWSPTPEFNGIPKAITHGAVYLVRDPRDVAVSFANHCAHDIDHVVETLNNPNAGLGAVGDGAVDIRQYIGTWSEHVRQWQNVKFPVLMIRYEDLLEDPFTQFHFIVQFLHIDMDEEVLKLAIENTSFEKLKAQEKKFGFMERCSQDEFFNKGQAGWWRDVLTEKQRNQIEEDHGEVMRDLGYL